MASFQRLMVAAIFVLAGMLVLKRGGKARAGLDPDESPMKGSVYAAPIPVYAGARFRESTGGNYYDDIGGPVTFTSKSWFFSIKEPIQEVADFYRKNLPPGAHPAEGIDGEQSFEWIPPGAAAGELVSVTIREGELQIGETVKAKAGN